MSEGDTRHGSNSPPTHSPRPPACLPVTLTSCKMVMKSDMSEAMECDTFCTKVPMAALKRRRSLCLPARVEGSAGGSRRSKRCSLPATATMLTSMASTPPLSLKPWSKA